MDIPTIIGIIGAAAILIGFVLNRMRVLETESVSYDGINAFGGLLLIIYALLIGSYPFAVLNVVWFVFAIQNVIRGIFVRTK